MTSKKYLVFAVAAFLVGLGAVAGSSYWINAYGLFGNVSHRSYTAYRGERTTKYLFAHNYVPANFDGLLLGASISLNWNTKRITSHKLYNASISGANISEQRLIADQVMSRRQLEWLVVVLHPYLTMTHGRRTEAMTPSEYWSSLGSLNLFFLESSKFLVENHFSSDRHNDYGDSDYSEGLTPEASRDAMLKYIIERRRSGKPSRNFEVAPGAFDDLRAILTRAAGQHTHVLGVLPPIYKERFEVEQADWAGYATRVLPLLPPGARVIDFNTPKFDALRSDISNFQDSGHLARKCADAVVDEIGRVLGDPPEPAAAASGYPALEH